MKKIFLLAFGLMLVNLSNAATYEIQVASGTLMADLATNISTTIGSDVTADVTLQFADGVTYFGGTDVLTLPVGVKSLTFTATAGANTQVNIKSITLQGLLNLLSFQNLKLNTTSSSTNLVGQTATNYPKSLVVNNCILSGYRGIFGAAAGEKISVLFNRCTFKTIGSYGVVNGGSMLKDVTFSYCKFINIATIFSNNSWTIDADNPFTMRNCTFYNSTTQITNGFFRPASNPVAGAIIERNIVASTVDNTNGLMYSSSGYNGLKFKTSFKTSNYTGAKLDSIQVFTGTALDLFTDPENGDFSFKTGVTGDILNSGANAADTTTGNRSIHQFNFTYRNNNVIFDGSDIVSKLYMPNGVLVREATSNILSTTGLKSGIYILKAIVDGERFTEKLFVPSH